MASPTTRPRTSRSQLDRSWRARDAAVGGRGRVTPGQPDQRERERDDGEKDPAGAETGPRGAPAGRALHVEPAVQRQGAPRAEDGAAGDAEDERRLLHPDRGGEYA